MAEESETRSNDVELATELTIAWLSNPNTRATNEEAMSFLKSAHGTVSSLSSAGSTSGSDEEAASVAHEPAVTARKSLANPNHILSLIDGKPYKTLTRHLSTHGLTPETYRERYGLKADYPMVALAYSEHRRKLAKEIGLGRKLGETRAKAAAPAAVANVSPQPATKPAAATPASAKAATAKAATKPAAAKAKAAPKPAAAAAPKAKPGRKPATAKGAPA